LNTAATELTDLQNKAVVKQALIGTVVNNDMANTLISNASTVGFRATTYNLGNALAGTVLVNASLADVHYGTVAANTIINFGSWPPTGTQSNIQVRLNVSNANAVITFSANVIASNNTGATTLENFVSNGGLVTVTAPYGVSEMDYNISTTDCGNTLYIEPVNRPRQSTQIQQRIPSPVGAQGDVAGTVCVGTGLSQITCTNTTNGTNLITCNSTSEFYIDMPISFNGAVFGGIVDGATYYVKTINSITTFTIAYLPAGTTVPLSTSSGTMYGNPISYMYVCTDTYDAVTVGPKTVISTYSSNNEIVLNSITSLITNAPVQFNGTPIGGLSTSIIYYIKSIVSGNSSITVSPTIFNGVAGSVVNLSNATVAANSACQATSYNGTTIWKQIPLLVSTATAALTDIAVSGNATIGGNAVINGNLTVNGTYTYENVSSLSIEDPIISLGRGPNNTALVSNDNKDRGEQLWYYSGSEKSAFIGWDDSQGKLIAAADVSIASEVVTVNSYGNFAVGNLDSVNISSGNISASNVTATTFTGALVGSATTAGTVTTNAQPNITSTGTLTSLVVTGNIDAGNFNTSGTFTASNFTGNVIANNLSVSGTANIPTVAGIRIGGGLNGYYLVTDGTGNLSWVSGGGSGVGVVAGSNSQIQYNNAGSFGATAGFTFNSATNLLSAPGGISAVGNVTAGNIVTSGSLSVSGNANVGNLGTAGIIISSIVTGTAPLSVVSTTQVANLNVDQLDGYHADINPTASTVSVRDANANLSANNYNATGLVTVTGNITGGNLVTGGVLSVTGNANIGNLGIAGIITVNGNANVGNLGTSGNITGGNVTSNNYVIVSTSNSITAAGTTQSDATQLTKSINIVTTVPASSGVKLPSAEAGMRIIVRNSTSTALNVYPNTGAAIEPALANAAYTLNATTSMEFFCSTGGASGQWFTLF
jgi:hypothetical protein